MRKLLRATVGKQSKGSVSRVRERENISGKERGPRSGRAIRSDVTAGVNDNLDQPAEEEEDDMGGCEFTLHFTLLTLVSSFPSLEAHNFFRSLLTTT